MTVAFCDLVDSAALTQRLDPEDLHGLLREYAATAATVAGRHGGYVAQYLGDGVLLYFGYPEAQENSAEAAVRAALELTKAVRAIRRSIPGWVGRLDARVGIHTGNVVFGDIDEVHRRERLAFGEVPNVAARIQSLAAPNSVLLSEATYQLVKHAFDCETGQAHTLRGFARPMMLYRPMRPQERLRVDPPLVGRQIESDFLARHWREATEGSLRTVLVYGEPGIGKSRQLASLREYVRSDAPLILEARCSRLRRSTTLYPFLQLFERQLGLDPGALVEHRRRALRAFLAQFDLLNDYAMLATLTTGPLSDGSKPLDSSPQRQYQAALEALLRTLTAVAARRPVLVLVEDLQWADSSSLDLIALLIQQGSPRPILVVLTARPEFRAPWVSASSVATLPINRLAAADAESIATRVIGGRTVDASLLQRVLARAEGVPLFVEELTRALVEVNSAPAGETSPSSMANIPATLQDSLAARLDRLGNARAVVQLASVFGREFQLDELASASDLPIADLRTTLAQLVDVDIIFPLSTDSATYSFKHALIQEAAYGSMLRHTRQQHHGRIARALLENFPKIVSEEPEVLAFHYDRAELVVDALRFLRAAGLRSIARSAFVEAIDTFGRSLDRLASLAPTDERDRNEIEIRAALGLALISVKGYSAPEVAESYDRARELCQRFGDAPTRVLYGIWAVHFVRGDAAAIDSLVPSFKQMLEPERPAALRLIANATLGVRLFQLGELIASREHLAAATEALDRLDPRTQHETLLGAHGFEALLHPPLFLAFFHVLRGNAAEGWRVFREALQVAETSKHPYLVCTALSFGASLARETGDADKTRFFADRSIDIAREHGFYFWLAIATCARGWSALHTAEQDQALEEIRAGLALLGNIGSSVNRGYFLSYLIDGCLATGRLDEGLRAANEGLTLCERNLGRNYQPDLERLKGEILRRQGQHGDTEVLFRSALARSQAQGATLLEARARKSLASLSYPEPASIVGSAALQDPEG